MEQQERRKYIRPESLYLLDYLALDEQGQASGYSMGRTLEVSEGGLLFETHRPLAIGHYVRITIGLKEDLVDVTGKIAHTSEDAQRYQSGVQFIDVDDTSRKVINKYVEAFRERSAQENEPEPENPA